MATRFFDALTAQSLDAPSAGALRLDTSDDRSVVVGPAFFDPQVNGYAGVDFQNPHLSLAELEFAAEAVRSAGCSHFLLTIITNTADYLESQFSRLGEFLDRSALLRETIPGFHLEGPFLNGKPGFIGAHDPACVMPPNLSLFQHWQKASGNRIRMLTLGPEAVGSPQFISEVSRGGVWVAAGHTDASYGELRAAVAAGLKFFTHLGNGCPGDLHRHDNIVHRVLSIPELSASLVPDGIHLPPFYLAQLVRELGAGRLVVTTDAMSAAGAPPGEYPLGKKRMTVGADRIVWDLPGKNFAGSSLSMVEGFYNLVRFGGLSVDGAWRAWTRLRAEIFPGLATPALCLPFPFLQPTVLPRV